MLLYIVKDKQFNREQYVYYENKKLYGYTLDDSGYHPIDSNIHEKVWNLLRGKFLRYISKYKGYDVFLDENDYKHFYKDGQENFRLFLEVNGKEYALWNNKKRHKKMKSVVKEIVIGGIIIILGVSAFELYEPEINEFLSQSKTIVVDISELYAGNESIDVDTAIALVNQNPNVEILQNDLLLKTIFPYYQGTKMEYRIKDRLTDLNYSYYDSEEHDSAGYYDITNPNVLNIVNDKCGDSWVKRHEYNHLLQDVSVEERVIIESMADIMIKEFYGEEYGDTGYYFLDRDTYMLAAIIGPEPFYQMIYSGNTEPFYQSIEPYLSAEELIEFKEILRTVPKEKDVHSEYEQFIKKIYQNKFNQDLSKNDFMNCLFTDLSFFERVNLFNPYKVDTDQKIIINDEVAIDLVSQLQNVEYQDGHYYIRVNLYDQFREQYENIKAGNRSRVLIK